MIQSKVIVIALKYYNHKHFQSLNAHLKQLQLSKGYRPKTNSFCKK